MIQLTKDNNSDDNDVHLSLGITSYDADNNGN